jgi:glutamyl-tRNA synthetase
VLNEVGEKMSKRHGAKPVLQYRDEGYLADAVVNYLARLGWSHGDDEIFSRDQLVQWFDLDHLGRSAGQFDEAKLRWVNAQHIKLTADATLAPLVADQMARLALPALDSARLEAAIALYKDRCATTREIAEWLAMYVAPVYAEPADIAAHVTPAVAPAVATLRARLRALGDWRREAIALAIKETLAAHGLKMPRLAMAVRVLVCGRPQTPSLDAVLALFEPATVLERLGEG